MLLRANHGIRPPSGPGIQCGKSPACEVAESTLGLFAAISTIARPASTITIRQTAPGQDPSPAPASAPARPRSHLRLVPGAPTCGSRRGSVLASLDMKRGSAGADPQKVRPQRRREVPHAAGLRRPALTPRPPPVQRARLDRLNVDGLRTLVALLGVVGDLGALLQRAVALAVDPGVMNEQVLVAVVRGDETERLVVAEPLYGASWHVGNASTVCACCTRRMLHEASTCERLHCFRRSFAPASQHDRSTSQDARVVKDSRSADRLFRRSRHDFISLPRCGGSVAGG